MRVSLITTGQMERRGLARGLQRLFPDHSFSCIDDRPGQPFGGFTSYRLGAEAREGGNEIKLVEAMIGQLIPPRRGVDPADIAIVVDDLELCNVDQAGVVADVFRRAVVAKLAELEGRASAGYADRVRAALRERGSLHLAVPMIESWLFGDPDGPHRAGVPLERVWQLAPGSDPEEFTADDPDYAGDDGAACALAAGSAPPWLTAERTRHPKQYLQYLCRTPGAKNCTTYRESEGGATALSWLSWEAVLSGADHCSYVRALLDDVAESLREQPVGVPLDRALAPVTSIRTRRAAPVLRNL